MGQEAEWCPRLRPHWLGPHVRPPDVGGAPRPRGAARALIGYCTCPRPPIGRALQLSGFIHHFVTVVEKESDSFFLYSCLSFCGGKICFAEEKCCGIPDCGVATADTSGLLLAVSRASSSATNGHKSSVEEKKLRLGEFIQS